MATIATTSSQRVKVFVRARPTPYFASEFINTRDKIISIQLPISPRRISQQTQEWSFLVDGILSNSSQEEVYADCAHDVVAGVMNGINGTIFAYGQTGAGKTYTMSGEAQYRLRGIIPRALSQIFKTVRERDDSTTIIRISCLEIYNETLTDLLEALPKSGNFLSLSENERGASIKGLSVRVAENEEEALNMFFEAEKNRLVGEHTLNKQCSRSHVIFTVMVECHSDVSASSEFTISKLHLVDLAGSERLGIADHSGTVVTEAIYINKSLSFLEQVVMALAEKKRSHIPYRHCKLTQILKGCIGGNCNSIMIANIRGEREHLENTLGTLRFSERIMGVCANPQRNVHYNPVGLIQKYERDIKAMKEEMAMQELLHGKQSSKTAVTSHLTEGQVATIKDGVKHYITGDTNNLEFNSVREIKEIFSQFKEFINSMKREHQEELSKLQEQLSKVDASSSGSTEEKPAKVTKGGRFNIRKATGPASPTTTEPEQEDFSDKKQEVGVSDGQGYSIGQAPGDFANPKLAKKRISFLPQMSVSTDANRKKLGKVHNISADAAQEFCIDEETTAQPYSPPSRVEAFELFKKGRGKEINKIFLQNKDLLQRKRKAAYDVSCRLNQLKQRIDELRKKLEDKKKAHIRPVTTTDGRQVLDNEEYNYFKDLQETKKEYKTQYAILEGLQVDIPYCDQYTQQSRQKLVDEFDVWYKMAFIGDKPTQVGDETSSISSPIEHTETNRFKDLQNLVLLQGDPSTMAFYYAQLRTGKRGITERKGSIRKRGSMILGH